MSDDIYIQLSRLLDDDLPPSEAAQLRRRIASEPAVADAYASLSGAVEGLSRLPRALAPPAALDARVASIISPGRPAAKQLAWWWLPSGIGMLAVAAALLMIPVPPPTVTLVAGSQVVDGTVNVLASDVEVAVSGRARISLEPASDSARVGVQEVNPMMARTISAAGAGALLTVAVYEGSATISTPSQDVVLSAGEERTVSVLAPPSPERSSPSRPLPSAGSDRDLSLGAHVADLERELASLRLERDLQNGALDAMEGTVQEWPSDISASFEASAFTDQFESLVASDESLELVDVDCEEYPCMAVVRSYSDREDWMITLRDQVLSDWQSSGEGFNASVQVNQTGTGEDSVRLVGIGISDASHAADETRSGWRMEGWLQDLSLEARAAQPASP